MRDSTDDSATTPIARFETALLWVRRDLRVTDNRALFAAVHSAKRVVRSLQPPVIMTGSCVEGSLNVDKKTLSLSTCGPDYILVTEPCRRSDLHADSRGMQSIRLAPGQETASLLTPKPFAAMSQIPVFIWAPEEEGQLQPGRCSRWWLHESLVALEKDLESLGSNLIYRYVSSTSAAPQAGKCPIHRNQLCLIIQMVP